MKTLAIVSAVLLVVLAAGVLALDRLVAGALERTLTRTFGTEATVESVKPGIFSGRTTVGGLRVANPEGFEDAAFLTLDEVRLTADLPSLVFEDTVEVREMVLEGLELDLRQQGGRSNFGPVLAHLRQVREERDETRYRIRMLVIRDVRARVRLGIAGIEAGEATVEVPVVRLENVGAEEPISTSRLARRVVEAVLRRVLRDAGGLSGLLEGLLGSASPDPPPALALRR